jgi:predicted secreted hydrolase
MRQAVETIKRFTEKEKDLHLYQRRMIYKRVEAGKKIAQASLEAEAAKLQDDNTKLEANNINLKEDNVNLQTEKDRLQIELDNAMKLIRKQQQLEVD